MRITIDRKTKLTLPTLIAAAVMIAGVVSVWSYAFVLHRRSQNALEGVRGTAPKATASQPAAQAPAGAADQAAAALPAADGPQPTALPGELADLVRERHLFGAPNDVLILKGIVGDMALINDRWMRVGDQEGGATLIELAADRAVVDFLGERRELALWSPLPGAAATGGIPEGLQPRPTFGDPGRWGRRGGPGGFGPGGFGRDGFVPPGMSPEEFAQMRERFQRMAESGRSPEDFRRMRMEMERSRGGGGRQD